MVDDSDEEDEKNDGGSDDSDDDFKPDIGNESDNSEVAQTRALIERLTPKKEKPKTTSVSPAEKNKKAAKKGMFGGGTSPNEPISIEDSPAKAKSKTEAKKPVTKKTSKTSKKDDPKQTKLTFTKKAVSRTFQNFQNYLFSSS